MATVSQFFPNGTVLRKLSDSGGNLYYDGSPIGSGSVDYVTVFDAGDLDIDSKIVITHSLGTKFVKAVVANDNDLELTGYGLTFVDTNSCEFDFTGFNLAAETWTIRVL